MRPSRNDEKASMEFVKLFEPIAINTVTIPNRIVMPAMALFYTHDYTLTDRFKAFYRERAHGGVGLMTIGPMAIDKVGSNPFMLGFFDDAYIEPMREFVNELHRDTEVRVGVQFMQQGRFASSRFTGLTPIAPSAIASPHSKEVPREMTQDDIVGVEDAFAKAALRAREAGFDYLEIMAGGSYLIGEFLSPVTNHRTDGYGGPLDKRMSFGLEVIEKVRRAVGKDFLLGIRVSGHDFVKGGNTSEESAIFCAEAQKAGVDCINVTGGWHETNVPQITSDVPPGTYVYLARHIKEHVSVPVFASNRLGDPHIAEKVLLSGAADMICWGRPLIADPGLPVKARSRRLDEIVPCIACNQGCFDSLAAHLPVCCTLNPRVGREMETEIKKASKSKRVFVAGGGPAGMQCALTARQRGHDVTLFEKTERLGGQINLIEFVPGKEDFGDATISLTHRLKAAGVKVVLSTDLTTKKIKRDKPDVLVVASGARPARIKVPGIDRPNVRYAWDILDGSVSDIGKRVVIVGGGAIGCETALFIANFGVLDGRSFAFLVCHEADDFHRLRGELHKSRRKIMVLELGERIAGNVGVSTRWGLLKNLRLRGVGLRSGVKITGIEKDAVTIETENGTESVAADTIIIAVGTESVDDLSGDLDTASTQVVTIGDAKEPRKIGDAVREGFAAALSF
jgi:2,4-dienoyl-CoA reductase (NADPH2)